MNICLTGKAVNKQRYLPQFKYFPQFTFVDNVEEADVVVVFDYPEDIEIPKNKFVVGATLEPSWNKNNNYDCHSS